MSTLKPITPESIPRALDKAERYRLLHEAFFAESICLDVLAVDAGHQRALAIYLLALVDQFANNVVEMSQRARAVVARLTSEYERFYYLGIICERQALAVLHRGGHDASAVDWRQLHEAMGLYEKAHEALHDKTNDDATLRYNTCVRLLAAHRLTEPVVDHFDHPLE